MSVSTPFIHRPVGTILLAIGLLISGLVAYRFLPVAPLPSVDIPTIVVFASRPGADPETVANSLAAPLERRLGEIAGVTEITSTSSVGATSVVVQFDLKKSVEAAAHDVQAAINAAIADLPGDLPIRPYFRKFNPAETPIMSIALTSETLSMAQVYDAADSILAQRLSQVDGVAQVTINGAEKPAVRVRLDPVALANAGLAAQDVYAAIRANNVNGPTGGFQGPLRAETIGLNNQMTRAADYAPLVIKTAGGNVVRLGQVATVVDATTNARLSASLNGKPAILLSLTKSVDANVIETVDNVRAVLPLLAAWMPSDIDMTILSDRTVTIRASVHDVQTSLLISIGLVLLVVLVFMRRLVPTIAAAATVPLSLAGTLAAMWFCGFSLNNFTLMALTISVGFVVDDAIVMIENIVRHRDMGKPPLQAALDGAAQIGFTVVSISLSLVAVFIPVTFMGGVMGRMFHEFAATMTIAVIVSAVVSLTLTPMLCGRFMPAEDAPPRGLLGLVDRQVERGLSAIARGYAASLEVLLRWRLLMLALTLGAIGASVWLYIVIPKGFLPTQDTGLIWGGTLADPSISFEAMRQRQAAVVAIISADPAVAGVGSTVGVTSGWASLNRGQMTIALKPLAERKVSSEQVIARLRPQLFRVGGVQTFLFSAQELRGGGRQGGSTQFVLVSPDLAELREWVVKFTEALRLNPDVADVSSDQDRAGPQADIVIDRTAAARLGVSVAAVDNALNNAFAQRQVSIIYAARNQYRVVLETDPALQTDPAMLDRVFVAGAGGKSIPLRSVVGVERNTAPLAVRHQGQYPAATVTFNAAEGVLMGTAIESVRRTFEEMRMPDSIRGTFAGNARFLTESLSSQPLLIGAALLAIYIVLGVLYESLRQPVTILSTLPSAGLGALIAIWLGGFELSIMAIIGVLLLMGIVKKNAIMMIDFALEEERAHGRAPAEAIHAACVERFRPILMTTLAALLGALPLAFAFGTGAELRQPLGISIIGGLLVSQVLTLYTTPIVYLLMQPRRA